jgi:formate dehydrogenase (coenzyme F420) beta subunit
MIEQLRETCRRLLEEGSVQVIVGYGESIAGAPARPVFVRRSEDVAQLTWGPHCLANLTAYLTRKEVKALGNAAVVVKGCDEKALVVLTKESQVDRASLYVIGMACDGVGAPKCAGCELRTPRFTDEMIGTPSDAEPLSAANPITLDELMAKTPAERWEFWKGEFSRCVKCYACRQVCPLCYCERCIADKNRPQEILTSASLMGNFAWHITRSFHLAARCIECGECTRACPVGIPLALLNRTLAEQTAESFSYRPGIEPDAEPVFGAWSASDKEDFIR